MGARCWGVSVGLSCSHPPTWPLGRTLLPLDLEESLSLLCKEAEDWSLSPGCSVVFILLLLPDRRIFWDTEKHCGALLPQFLISYYTFSPLMIRSIYMKACPVHSNAETGGRATSDMRVTNSDKISILFLLLKLVIKDFIPNLFGQFASFSLLPSASRHTPVANL